jgi:two-component system cell cycle sensor histidine kinase/response regulator CckA
VTDAGTGMEPEVLQRVFEPFFTTKEKGRGTGLGLATVFGIVKEARGHIVVRSAPKQGSTFTLYLPLVPAPSPAEAGGAAGTSPRAAAGETILLAEDQDEVRSLTERALRAEGYTVLSCRNGLEALAVEAGHRGEIHLLLSDVMMPGLDGRELADAVRARRPAARVLLMSGYAEERPGETVRARAGEDLLPKPFTVTALLERVRGALARAVASR